MQHIVAAAALAPQCNGGMGNTRIDRETGGDTRSIVECSRISLFNCLKSRIAVRIERRSGFEARYLAEKLLGVACNRSSLVFRPRIGEVHLPKARPVLAFVSVREYHLLATSLLTTANVPVEGHSTATFPSLTEAFSLICVNAAPLMQYASAIEVALVGREATTLVLPLRAIAYPAADRSGNVVQAEIERRSVCGRKLLLRRIVAIAVF